MNLNEVATILKMSRDQVRIAIEVGIELPKSHKIARLEAHQVGNSYDIEESDLDGFIEGFESEDPGRHPPVKVCRELLLEARHGCAICGESTIVEFHHIIDFSSIGHYDTAHMLALCPTHHGMCTIGKIDRIAQYKYKKDLANNHNGSSQFIYSLGPANFSWEDLRQIITTLHSTVVGKHLLGKSGFDFSEINIAKKSNYSV